MARIREGTWFAMPLESGRFAVGVVARARGMGVLAYFFPEVWSKPPALEQVSEKRACDAIRKLQTGGLHLVDGRWPILGLDKSWRREDWPMPNFVRHEFLTGRILIVRYSDRDPLRAEWETPVAEAPDLEKDVLHGARSAEHEISKTLGELGPEPDADAEETMTSPAKGERGPTLTFDNDQAADWLAAFSRGGLASVRKAFRKTRKRGYLERDVGEAAIAAAEVVATLLGRPPEHVPDRVAAFAAKHPDPPDPELVREAVAAIDRVTGEDSEIRELWDEAEEDWLGEVRRLRDRLTS